MIEEHDIWESGHYSKFKQQGKDLGQRIKFAFKQAFESGFEKVIIIGSEHAELNRDLIDEVLKRSQPH